VRALRLVFRTLLPLLVAGVLFALLQGILSKTWTYIFMMAGISVVMAVSLNIVNGFTGQFSLGHAGFMAVGAYTAAKIVLAAKDVAIAGLPVGLSDGIVFLVALAGGMIMAGLAGFAVGMPSLRLRGDYLAIVTLGFNEIIRVIIENSVFLGQATGISGLPRRTDLVWVGVAAVFTVMAARRLVGSTHGRALLAIREDEVAAEAMGVDTTGYKVRAFVISSAFAGLAGGLLVHIIQLCTPKSFTFIKSIEVVAMIVLGGLGSISGAVLSAFSITVALELLRGFSEYRMVVYSVLLILMMLLLPTGLLGTREIWDMLPKWRRPASAGGDK